MRVSRSKLVKILLIVAIGYMTMKATQARGHRNNNPGNIKKNNIKWQGLSSIQTDPVFFQFQDAEHGIRALAIILKNYYERYGLDTVSKIIHRYAPSVENETFKYISFVCKKLNVTPSQQIDVYQVMPYLVDAIITYENGYQPYSAETIAAGIKIAGIEVSYA